MPSHSASSVVRLNLLRALAIVLPVVLAVVGINIYTSTPSHEYYAFAPRSANITIQPFDSSHNSVWNDALEVSAAQWNNAVKDVQITIDPQSPNTVGFAPLSAASPSSRARYSPGPGCLIGHCTFRITIDERFLTYADNETVMSLGVFLLTHELGHALGLADMPDSYDTASIMTRNKTYISRTPTPRDIELVTQRVQSNRASN